MSSDFLNSTEELDRVADELASLRRDIQNVSGLLTRIEKRLKVAFPNYTKLKKQSDKQESASMPTKTRDELLPIFETLLIVTKESGDKGFLIEIEKLSEIDLTSLAYELGISDSRRISQKKAREGIRKRVQESLLLSHQPRQNP